VSAAVDDAIYRPSSDRVTASQHVAYGCERLESTLVWRYWESPRT